MIRTVGPYIVGKKFSMDCIFMLYGRNVHIGPYGPYILEAKSQDDFRIVHSICFWKHVNTHGPYGPRVLEDIPQFTGGRVYGRDGQVGRTGRRVGRTDGWLGRYVNAGRLLYLIGI